MQDTNCPQASKISTLPFWPKIIIKLVSSAITHLKIGCLICIFFVKAKWPLEKVQSFMHRFSTVINLKLKFK